MTTEILDLEPVERSEPATQERLPALAENSPAAMMLVAQRQGASLEQIEKMLDLQERWERREAEKAFNAAFAAFRGEDLQVIKDRGRTSGPLQGQKYATLHAFVKATKEALSKHGLGIRWDVTKDQPEWIEVTCILKHAQGHSETVAMGGPPDTGPARNIMQARHSTISYLERYTLKAICGLAEQDDDDDGAGGASDKSEPDADMTTGRDAAMQGMEALTKWWGALDARKRTALQKEFGNLRRAAQEADRAAK